MRTKTATIRRQLGKDYGRRSHYGRFADVYKNGKYSGQGHYIPFSRKANRQMRKRSLKKSNAPTEKYIHTTN